MAQLNLTGAAGEYSVCAELCRQGLLAVLTPKNNPHFDVAASSPDGSKSITIQVKTRSVGNKLGWKLGAHITDPSKFKGQFVVLVNLDDDNKTDFYIYTPKELAKRVMEVYEEYISKPKKDGTPRKAVGFRWFDESSFKASDRARRNNWRALRNALSAA